jgi:two-component system, NarL family, sensor kinase
MQSGNDIYYTIISLTLVLILLLGFIVSFLFIYKSRQAKHRVEMQSVKEKYDREILKAQLEIKEQTLKNISEEIHDNVGQVLSLVVLSLSAIELNDIEKASVKIESITRLVETAVSDLRNLSKTLDAENIASVGLPALIKFELELLEKTGVYQTSFKLSGTEQKLDDQHEIVLYRIVQESLNNIIKHAGANSIKIGLNYSGRHLNIEIADNGIGFDIAAEAEKSIYKNGAGLKNMKRRAGLIGGSFDISSVLSEGTTVSVTVPLAQSIIIK